MAKIEIEESELAALNAVHKVVQTALANPKTRTTMLTIQKTLNPDAVIPELDATEGVMKAVNAVNEKLDSFMTRLNESETAAAERSRTAELTQRVQNGQGLLKRAGYQKEGIDAIEELMLSEGISSYAAGKALFESLNPPASPADMSRTSKWGSSLDDDIQSGEAYKRLWETQGQDDSWLNENIAKVRNEFRQ